MSHSSMQEQLAKEIEGLRADLAAIERGSGSGDSAKPRRRRRRRRGTRRGARGTGKDKARLDLKENETPQPANVNAAGGRSHGGSHGHGDSDGVWSVGQASAEGAVRGEGGVAHAPRDRDTYDMGEYALDGFDDDDDDDEGHDESTSGALPLLALALGDGIGDAVTDAARIRASEGVRASDEPISGNRTGGAGPVSRQGRRQHRLWPSQGDQGGSGRRTDVARERVDEGAGVKHDARAASHGRTGIGAGTNGTGTMHPSLPATSATIALPSIGKGIGTELSFLGALGAAITGEAPAQGEQPRTTQRVGGGGEGTLVTAHSSGPSASPASPMSGKLARDASGQHVLRRPRSVRFADASADASTDAGASAGLGGVMGASLDHGVSGSHKELQRMPSSVRFADLRDTLDRPVSTSRGSRAGSAFGRPRTGSRVGLRSRLSPSRLGSSRGAGSARSTPTMQPSDTTMAEGERWWNRANWAVADEDGGGGGGGGGAQDMGVTPMEHTGDSDGSSDESDALAVPVIGSLLEFDPTDQRPLSKQMQMARNRWEQRASRSSMRRVASSGHGFELGVTSPSRSISSRGVDGTLRGILKPSTPAMARLGSVPSSPVFLRSSAPVQPPSSPLARAASASASALAPHAHVALDALRRVMGTASSVERPPPGLRTTSSLPPGTMSAGDGSQTTFVVEAEQVKDARPGGEHTRARSALSSRSSSRPISRAELFARDTFSATPRQRTPTSARSSAALMTTHEEAKAAEATTHEGAPPHTSYNGLVQAYFRTLEHAHMALLRNTTPGADRSRTPQAPALPEPDYARPSADTEAVPSESSRGSSRRYEVMPLLRQSYSRSSAGSTAREASRARARKEAEREADQQRAARIAAAAKRNERGSTPRWLRRQRDTHSRRERRELQRDGTQAISSVLQEMRQPLTSALTAQSMPSIDTDAVELADEYGGVLPLPPASAVGAGIAGVAPPPSLASTSAAGSRPVSTPWSLASLPPSSPTRSISTAGRPPSFSSVTLLSASSRPSSGSVSRGSLRPTTSNLVERALMSLAADAARAQVGDGTAATRPLSDAELQARAERWVQSELPLLALHIEALESTAAMRVQAAWRGFTERGARGQLQRRKLEASVRARARARAEAREGMLRDKQATDEQQTLQANATMQMAETDFDRQRQKRKNAAGRKESVFLVRQYHGKPSAQQIERQEYLEQQYHDLAAGVLQVAWRRHVAKAQILRRCAWLAAYARWRTMARKARRRAAENLARRLQRVVQQRIEAGCVICRTVHRGWAKRVRQSDFIPSLQARFVLTGEHPPSEMVDEATLLLELCATHMAHGQVGRALMVASKACILRCMQWRRQRRWSAAQVVEVMKEVLLSSGGEVGRAAATLVLDEGGLDILGEHHQWLESLSVKQQERVRTTRTLPLPPHVAHALGELLAVLHAGGGCAADVVWVPPNMRRCRSDMSLEEARAEAQVGKGSLISIPVARQLLFLVRSTAHDVRRKREVADAFYLSHGLHRRLRRMRVHARLCKVLRARAEKMRERNARNALRRKLLHWRAEAAANSKENRRRRGANLLAHALTSRLTRRRVLVWQTRVAQHRRAEAAECMAEMFANEVARRHAVRALHALQLATRIQRGRRHAVQSRKRASMAMRNLRHGVAAAKLQRALLLRSHWVAWRDFWRWPWPEKLFVDPVAGGRVLTSRGDVGTSESAGRPPTWLPAESAWGWPRTKHRAAQRSASHRIGGFADDVRKRRAFRKSLRLLRLRKYIADDADAAAWDAAARLLQRWMRYGTTWRRYRMARKLQNWYRCIVARLRRRALLREQAVEKAATEAQCDLLLNEIRLRRNAIIAMKGECKNATVRAAEAAKLARVLLVEQQVAESQYDTAYLRLCDVDDEWGADSLRAKTDAVVNEGLERMRAQIRAGHSAATAERRNEQEAAEQVERLIKQSKVEKQKAATAVEAAKAMRSKAQDLYSQAKLEEDRWSAMAQREQSIADITRLTARLDTLTDQCNTLAATWIQRETRRLFASSIAVRRRSRRADEHRMQWHAAVQLQSTMRMHVVRARTRQLARVERFRRKHPKLTRFLNGVKIKELEQQMRIADYIEKRGAKNREALRVALQKLGNTGIGQKFATASAASRRAVEWASKRAAAADAAVARRAPVLVAARRRAAQKVRGVVQKHLTAAELYYETTIVPAVKRAFVGDPIEILFAALHEACDDYCEAPFAYACKGDIVFVALKDALKYVQSNAVQDTLWASVDRELRIGHSHKLEQIQGSITRRGGGLVPTAMHFRRFPSEKGIWMIPLDHHLWGRLRLAGVRESGWASGSDSSDEDSASDNEFERGILAGGGGNRAQAVAAKASADAVPSVWLGSYGPRFNRDRRNRTLASSSQPQYGTRLRSGPRDRCVSRRHSWSAYEPAGLGGWCYSNQWRALRLRTSQTIPALPPPPPSQLPAVAPKSSASRNVENGDVETGNPDRTKDNEDGVQQEALIVKERIAADGASSDDEESEEQRDARHLHELTSWMLESNFAYMDHSKEPPKLTSPYLDLRLPQAGKTKSELRRLAADAKDAAVNEARVIAEEEGLDADATAQAVADAEAEAIATAEAVEADAIARARDQVSLLDDLGTSAELDLDDLGDLGRLAKLWGSERWNPAGASGVQGLLLEHKASMDTAMRSLPDDERLRAEQDRTLMPSYIRWLAGFESFVEQELCGRWLPDMLNADRVGSDVPRAVLQSPFVSLTELAVARAAWGDDTVPPGRSLSAWDRAKQKLLRAKRAQLELELGQHSEGGSSSSSSSDNDDDGGESDTDTGLSKRQRFSHDMLVVPGATQRRTAAQRRAFKRRSSCPGMVQHDAASFELDGMIPRLHARQMLNKLAKHVRTDTQIERMQRLRKQFRWVVRSHCVVVHDPGENHVDPVLGCSVVRVRFLRAHNATTGKLSRRCGSLGGSSCDGLANAVRLVPRHRLRLARAIAHVPSVKTSKHAEKGDSADAVAPPSHTRRALTRHYKKVVRWRKQNTTRRRRRRQRAAHAALQELSGGTTAATNNLLTADSQFENAIAADKQQRVQQRKLRRLRRGRRRQQHKAVSDGASNSNKNISSSSSSSSSSSEDSDNDDASNTDGDGVGGGTVGRIQRAARYARERVARFRRGQQLEARVTPKRYIQLPKCNGPSPGRGCALKSEYVPATRVCTECFQAVCARCYMMEHGGDGWCKHATCPKGGLHPACSHEFVSLLPERKPKQDGAGDDIFTDATYMERQKVSNPKLMEAARREPRWQWSAEAERSAMALFDALQGRVIGSAEAHGGGAGSATQADVARLVRLTATAYPRVRLTALDEYRGTLRGGQTTEWLELEPNEQLTAAKVATAVKDAWHEAGLATDASRGQTTVSFVQFQVLHLAAMTRLLPRIQTEREKLLARSPPRKLRRKKADFGYAGFKAK